MALASYYAVCEHRRSLVVIGFPIRWTGLIRVEVASFQLESICIFSDSCAGSCGPGKRKTQGRTCSEQSAISCIPNERCYVFPQIAGQWLEILSRISRIFGGSSFDPTSFVLILMCAVFSDCSCRGRSPSHFAPPLFALRWSPSTAWRRSLGLTRTAL